MQYWEASEMKERLMGEHWNAGGYSKLYQLYRRVETVAHHLEKRRQRGWVPTKQYIAELYDISTQLTDSRII
jgi:hypothetical protein